MLSRPGATSYAAKPPWTQSSRNVLRALPNLHLHVRHIRGGTLHGACKRLREVSLRRGNGSATERSLGEILDNDVGPRQTGQH